MRRRCNYNAAIGFSKFRHKSLWAFKKRKIDRIASGNICLWNRREEDLANWSATTAANFEMARAFNDAMMAINETGLIQGVGRCPIPQSATGFFPTARDVIARSIAAPSTLVSNRQLGGMAFFLPRRSGRSKTSQKSQSRKSRRRICSMHRCSRFAGGARDHFRSL